MMRHFLGQASAVSVLPGGMAALAGKGLLVARSGLSQRSPTEGQPATLGAKAISAVTTAAKPDLAVATGAVEEAEGVVGAHMKPATRACPVGANGAP
jgi:hypothetical protein